jgi:hypothetical protein
MMDRTRNRINAAFEDELSAAPVPPSLRALSVRAAVTARRHRSAQRQVVALVAAVLAIALVATLVIGSHALRNTPALAQPAPSSVPPLPRSGASVVYDGSTHELVMFGGALGSRVSNETWTWDGKNWRLYNLRTAPAPRVQQVMAYDESHHDVVMFGGMAIAPTNSTPRQSPVNDTWTWNGSTWTQRHPSLQPTFSFDWPATMAFDPVTKTVLLFGFEKVTSGNSGTMQPETWSWNGSDWTELSPSTTPQSPGQFVNGRAHLYFGNGIWEFDGQNWIQRQVRNASDAPAVFDVVRGEYVAFDHDTWTWDGGSTWIRQHPHTNPTAIGYLAYFPPLREVVMWGDELGTATNDMWAWDGVNWSRLQGGTVEPTPSAGHLDSATPAQAEAFIRRTVTSTSPVLLPAWLPNGMDAVVDATADYFTVTYRSDQRDKEIYFAIAVANPPPAVGPHATSTRVKFRKALAPKYGQAGYVDYVVYDTTNPQSQRYLLWSEPGTVSPSAAGEGFSGPGVPYFLSTTGLTDQEFWQVANSLQ